MNDNLYWKIIWVIAYGITLWLTIKGSMSAMYWMAGAMFVEAVVSLIYHFIPAGKTKR